MKDLGELVRRARKAKNLTLRDTASLAVAAGGRIDHSTISKIENGRAVAPDRRTLEALSTALDLPLRELEDAAQVEPLGRRFDLPQEYASRLSGAEREAIRQLVRVMAESKGKTDARHAEPPPPTDLATRRPAHGADARPQQKIEGIAAHKNRDPEIGPDDLPHET